MLGRTREQTTNRRWIILHNSLSAIPKNEPKGRRIRTPGPRCVVLFVLTHTISSQRRNPHLASSSRPRSSPSDEPWPTQRKTKLGSAESAGIGSARSCSHETAEYCGSMRTTSNLHGCSALSCARGRNAGRCALASTATRLSASSFCCLGYLSSNRQHTAVSIRRGENRKKKKRKRALFESPLELGAEHPVLRPFTAVDVLLRVVVADRLLLGHVVLVLGHARELRRREVAARELLELPREVRVAPRRRGRRRVWRGAPRGECGEREKLVGGTCECAHGLFSIRLRGAHGRHERCVAVQRCSGRR